MDDPPASFVAGCLAGIAGCIVGHPFDTLKLVQQTSTSSGVTMYQGYRKLMALGGQSTLWRGIMPALSVQVITSGFLFGTQKVVSDKVTHLLGRQTDNEQEVEVMMIDEKYRLQQAMSISSVQCATLSGFLTGGLLAPIVCPLEGFKCRSQVAQMAAAATPPLSSPSNIVGRLFHGFMPSVLRCSFGNAAFFGVYSLFQSQHHAAGSSAVGGACAGVAFWIVGFPFDVLKSRMQTASINSAAPAPAPAPTSQLRYAAPTMRATFKNIFKEAGMRGFYKGLPVTLLRAVPMNAAVLYTYELVLRMAM